ncbi:hypothetical protein B0H67DRAFT_594246 [Lasiosphaeris hirsuta]|uniref:NAD-dependent epimerase/dehydratase domain-containing protein n=1 Tax=Lasiosphaeris hirsuta TaxID=260670 RepID=A0AA40DLD1_9PEZI|nr:hypothetical protein B0H67DRAFT_594246 [Lasiosphaeris hirsuta]
MTSRQNIIITGAGGLVGPLLAARLLNSPQYHLILTDLADPIIPAGVAHPENATAIKGDITDPAFVASLVASAQPLHAVFVFHGIMSAGSEANFELSLRVNVDSVRLLADHVRVSSPRVRFVYASSLAVFGQPLPAGPVTDDVTPTPQGTYGAHKLMNEIYLNELHRRGFLDVFIVRFPTISVRPGKPTAAASSFLSGIIREPMHGLECVVPLRDRAFKSFLASPRTIGHINFPGVSVSVQEMLDALATYGGEDKLQLVKEETDTGQERILRRETTVVVSVSDVNDTLVTVLVSDTISIVVLVSVTSVADATAVLAMATVDTVPGSIAKQLQTDKRLEAGRLVSVFVVRSILH